MGWGGGSGGGGKRGEDGGDEGGAEGDRGWDDFSPDVQHMCPKSPVLILGVWAVGRGVYCPQKRSSISSSLLENYSGR